MPQFDEESAARALSDGVPLLARQALERELSVLGSRILDAQRDGAEDLARELTRERMALFRRSRPSRPSESAENRGDLADEDA